MYVWAVIVTPYGAHFQFITNNLFSLHNLFLVDVWIIRLARYSSAKELYKNFDLYIVYCLFYSSFLIDVFLILYLESTIASTILWNVIGWHGRILNSHFLDTEERSGIQSQQFALIWLASSLSTIFHEHFHRSVVSVDHYLNFSSIVLNSASSECLKNYFSIKSAIESILKLQTRNVTLNYTLQNYRHSYKCLRVVYICAERAGFYSNCTRLGYHHSVDTHLVFNKFLFYL